MAFTILLQKMGFFFINGHAIYHFSLTFLQILEILAENKHFYHLRVQIKNQIS